MPQVGSGNEPLTETAGFAYTGSLWVPISCAADGKLDINYIGHSAVDAQNHGYLSSAWQKDPLRMGYSDTTFENIANTNANAGTNELYSTQVPEGEVHVYTSIVCMNENSVSTLLRVFMLGGGETTRIVYKTNPPAGNTYAVSGTFVFKEDYQWRVTFLGCVAGDTLRVAISGYKFDIDQ